MNVNLEIDIPKSFHAHVDAAVMRLRYLHPSWEVSEGPGLVKVTNVAASDVLAVRREVNYAIYRERIRSEGAPLRKLLLKSVMT